MNHIASSAIKSPLTAATPSRVALLAQSLRTVGGDCHNFRRYLYAAFIQPIVDFNRHGQAESKEKPASQPFD
jgi:hypothetical protein